MTSGDSTERLWVTEPAVGTSSPRRARRRAKRIDDLLRTTAEVVAERGYEGASLDEIAERLDLGKAAIYHYYEGKEALVYACLETCHEHVTDVLSAIADDETASATARLRAMIVRQLEMTCVEYPELSRLFLYPMTWPDSVQKAIKRWRREHDTLFKKVIDEGVRAGDFRPADAETSRVCLHGALNHAPLWLRNKPRVDELIEKISDTVLDMFDPCEVGADAQRRR